MTPPITRRECEILARMLSGPEPTVPIDYLRQFVDRVQETVARERDKDRWEMPAPQRPFRPGFEP